MSQTLCVPITYVVVWECQYGAHNWRPYPPHVAQLLERAHLKKLNKIYLKDAAVDPSLSNYNINLINFEQYCQSTGEICSVRREYYPHTSPAAKGAKWEWCEDNNEEWNIYDMDVQEIIEIAWCRGNQTVDISQKFPTCPQIINFCNMTQVRSISGVVRPIRRLSQPSYPMVKLTQAEITSMLQRKEERRKADLSTVVKKKPSNTALNFSKKSFKASSEIGKKAVKQFISHIFHKDNNGGRDIDQSIRAFDQRLSCALARSSISQNGDATDIVHRRSFSANQTSSFLGSGDRGSVVIGHPSSMSEVGISGKWSCNRQYSNLIIRRPSVDTISTYLSQEEARRGDARNRYYFNARNSSVQSPRSFCGSQELLSLYNKRYGNVAEVEQNDADDDDSVFTVGPSASVVAATAQHVNVLHNRVLSDPNLSHDYPSKQNSLYVNHSELIATRNNSKSLQRLSSQAEKTLPTRGYSTLSENSSYNLGQTSPKKPPIPTPRNVSNISSPKRAISFDISDVSTEKIILKYSQLVIDPNAPGEFCIICSTLLDSPKEFSSSNQHDCGLRTVICLSLCQHKFHMCCLQGVIYNQSGGPTYIRCPNCQRVSGEIYGDMPDTGTMQFNVIPKGLCGYSDYHSIQITYDFKNGIQGSRHPKPGRPFFAIGFPRTAFLPDTEVGRKVLTLLQTAFERKLTFEIGSNGSHIGADVIVWSGRITHKTEFGPIDLTNGSNSPNTYANPNGFPDSTYLERVMVELSLLGIE